MFERGGLPDPVAQIEHMWPPGKSFKHPQRLLLQFGPARNQQQRIKVALDRKPGGQGLRRPHRIDCFIETQRINPGFARISRQLFACTFGESDHRNMRETPPRWLHWGR